MDRQVRISILLCDRNKQRPYHLVSLSLWCTELRPNREFHERMWRPIWPEWIPRMMCCPCNTVDCYHKSHIWKPSNYLENLLRVEKILAAGTMKCRCKDVVDFHGHVKVKDWDKLGYNEKVEYIERFKLVEDCIRYWKLPFCLAHPEIYGPGMFFLSVRGLDGYSRHIHDSLSLGATMLTITYTIRSHLLASLKTENDAEFQRKMWRPIWPTWIRRVTKPSECPSGDSTWECIYHLDQRWLPSEYLFEVMELEGCREDNLVAMAEEEERRKNAVSDCPDRILYDDGSEIHLSTGMRARLGNEKMKRIARNNAAIVASNAYKLEQRTNDMRVVYDVIRENEKERLERALEAERKKIARVTDAFAMDEEETLALQQHMQILATVTESDSRVEIEEDEQEKKKRHGTVMEAERKKNARITYNSAAIDEEETYLDCCEEGKNEEEMGKACIGGNARYGWLVATLFAPFK